MKVRAARTRPPRTTRSSPGQMPLLSLRARLARGLPLEAQVPDAILNDAQLGNASAGIAPENHQAQLRRAERVGINGRQLQDGIGTAARDERLSVERDCQRRFRLVADVAAGQLAKRFRAG